MARVDLLISLLCTLTFLHRAHAALAENRRPALYTQAFGDCLNDASLLDITRFDAFYYKDNLTVAFGLEGTTQLNNESIMLYLSVYAYGESRYDKIFDPCNANIYSLCPTNSSVPIVASGFIPVDSSDISGIPPLALSIPDFEGQAILRVFANSTQSEIGCFSALISNGHSMSHPAAVGTVLGLFTFVAMAASFATAIYGADIPTVRTHYAHSLSVFVVFAVFHHIFFTGALSMNWPSILPAWWSNFAWAGGMIYVRSMQESINKLLGQNLGSTTFVGAAAQGTSSDGTGGGYSISAIYRRNLQSIRREPASLNHIIQAMQDRQDSLLRRGLENSSSGFDWYGPPVQPGLPLPGNYSGFAGTLSGANIPASNAFMTGFLWLLILILIVTGTILIFRFLLEALIRFRLVNNDRLPLFRKYWRTYIGAAAMRICYISFFMMIFLALFQFVYKGSGGVIAIAALVFIAFFIGMLGVAAFACHYRLRYGRFSIGPDRLHVERSKALGPVPWYGFNLESYRLGKSSPRPSVGSIPAFKVIYTGDGIDRPDVHEDEEYIRKFGWLSARFRRTKWWFFSFWLVYEFVRACFYGAAAGKPLVQVFGLLVVEFIALITITLLKPFEGSRLNLIMVYLLGFSKVATVALSSAFDTSFELSRVTTAAIGMIIIAIQGLLTIALMIAIVLGAISSYMSLTRNRESFKPKAWAPYRDRYFLHVDRAALDQPAPPPALPEQPKGPHFNVNTVRRIPKIEDEDEPNDPYDVYSVRNSHLGTSVPGTRLPSRANSMHSTMSYSNLPFGARPHRISWSTRDFADWPGTDTTRNSASEIIALQTMRSQASLRDSYGIAPARVRTPNRSSTMPLPRRSRGVSMVNSAATDKGKARESSLEEDIEEARPATGV